jgi:hypothetical protein
VLLIILLQGNDRAENVPQVTGHEDFVGNPHQRKPHMHSDVRFDVIGYKEICDMMQMIFKLVDDRVRTT